MSLKTRLRISIMVLVLAVVAAFSALSLHSIAGVTFGDLLDRATFIAQQVQSTLLQRLGQQMAAYPPTGSLEETKAVWTAIVIQDEELAASLRNSLASSRTVIEIQVVGESGVVLSSSDPASVGEKAEQLPHFADWQARSHWRQLIGAFGDRSNYVVSIPLGVAEQATPVFRVRVIISSLLLRHTLQPQLEQLGAAFLVSLLAALALAVLGSNIAFLPLARVSAAIDRIAHGEPLGQSRDKKGGSNEVAAIESKLQVLGQQFQGARADAVDLRSNIEQLLERMEEAVLLFDRNDRLIMTGRAAENIFGRGRWELLGRTIADLFPPASPAGAMVRTAIEFRKSLQHSPITIERDGQASVRLLMDVELLEAFPTRDLVGTQITLRDAETRREIGTQLDLSAKLTAISRLTGGVAHEIKNPLNSIALHLEVLRARIENRDAAAEGEIEVISREITRLDRVVKTFLDFNRPVDLNLSEVEAGQLVGEIAALMAPEARKRHIEMTVDTGPGGLILRADRDLFKQAVLNVVMNGIDAMSDGGRLCIEVKKAGADCVIGVADEGGGIPAELRGKIFNLYFTTKEKGSGIGLAMAFRAVQLHNGSIDFASEEGKGTSFWLRFPLLESDGKES
jgi:PAS domain S-box-containing protein